MNTITESSENKWYEWKNLISMYAHEEESKNL